jgi:hypothetical protein
MSFLETLIFHVRHQLSFKQNKHTLTMCISFLDSWTAVSIEDSWCFVNCNWGARHVKCPSVADKEEMESGLFYQCDEFYFITDPMIPNSSCFSHRP